MTRILTPQFTPPRFVTAGDDGIPNYIVATSGSPYRYLPPPGYKLVIYHENVRLHHVVEADRLRGWAVGLHYRTKLDGSTEILGDDADGLSQHRLYQGRITFQLEQSPVRN